MVAISEGKAARPARRPAQVLRIACGAHALHDGFTDVLYVLLPVWQAEFALGYAAVGALRALYAGAMAGLQVPASALARRLGGPVVLAGGTAVAGLAYLLAGASSSFLILAAALILGGAGSSTQHPISASLVAEAYEERGSRTALGTYNFAGDLGKMALPAGIAGLLALMAWRSAVLVLAALGLAGAAAILLLLRGRSSPSKAPSEKAAAPKPSAAPRRSVPRHGFPVLMAIGMVDSATRMGFLTFLPFLLKAKGADVPMVGLALTLL